MKKFLYTATFLGLLPSITLAHGFYRYISTPITPPIPFIWVCMVYAFAFIIINAVFWSRKCGNPGDRSTLMSIAFFICFSISFFIIGCFATSITTAPPPGLGMPHPVFWGFSWEQAGILFISWNLKGILFLLVWSLIFLKPWRTGSGWRWAMIFLNIFLYCLCTIPYAASGAWLHGSGGGYITGGCKRRLEFLNKAVIKYADKHNGRLPEATGLDDLMGEIYGYLSHKQNPYISTITVCPLDRAYNRQPHHYTWNTNFSGVHIRDINIEQVYNKGGLIICPYHHWDSIWATDSLLNKNNLYYEVDETTNNMDVTSKNNSNP